MTVSTLQELYAFNRWANDKALAITDGLSAEQLDRSFDMGPGTLRETLKHLYGAGWIWYQRIGGSQNESLPHPSKFGSTGELSATWHRLDDLRNEWIASLSDAELLKTITYKNLAGETYTNHLGGILLHVANHGIHHRAQFVNMVRQVGGPVPKPGLDYIFYRLEKIKDAAPPLDLATIRTYEGYADWGTRKLLDIAAKLTDAQLDRSFEMGLGTLRKTLSHLAIAEEWWHTNWTKGPAGAFPPADDKIAIADLANGFDAAWAARDQFVARLNDGDLTRPVTVKPRPDLTIEFPLGVSLVQLCGHATHHRAQMLNMLRHIGVQPPGLDLVLWLRESEPRP